MKRIILLFTLTILSFSVFSQYIHQIKADSVRIHNDSCKAELILENSTKNVEGFLYNKGNGRTEFRRGILNIGDSLYIIGADTLRLNSSKNINNSNNVFYVSKKFVGAAAAVITGKTLDSINSSNPSYNYQLANAIPGSITRSYPDPFSARNAAIEAITAGKILNATIIIQAGNIYTVGSDNPTQNGDLNYNANSNIVADVGFSSSNSTTIASLCQDKINYYFEQNSKLLYINSAYTIWMTYYEDLTDATWESGIYGHGSFKQYYGQKQGFSSAWCLINNANALFTFNADYIELQYFLGFRLYNVAVFNIDIKTIYAGYVNILNVQLNRNGNGRDMYGYFNCDNFVYGEDKIKNTATDYWPAFSIGVTDASVNNSLRNKNINIKIGNANIKVNCSEYDTFFMQKGLSNTNLNFNIDNLHQTSSALASNSLFGSLIGSTFSHSNNVLMNVDIKNAVTEYPLFGMLKNSYADSGEMSKFNFHCGLHRKLPSLIDNSEWAKRNINIQNDWIQSNVLAKMVISGTYINESNSEVVAMDYTNLSKITELKGYFKTTAVGKHVMVLNGSQDKRLAITDATLINDGTVPCIAIKGSQEGYLTSGGIPLNTSRTVYIKNVHANAVPDTNVVLEGDSIRVVPDLSLYY